VALPDYLWGIETNFFSQFAAFRNRFQTTYEELKLAFHRHIRIYQGRASRLPMRNWNCAGPEIIRPSTNRASRLPMRNWNVYRPLDDSISERLPDYLWGIETWTELCLMQQRELPDYLWGIETRELVFDPPLLAYASRLPMRNWNCISSLR